MSDRILIIFIDESGDFGSYEPHAPFYIAAMVLHDQQHRTEEIEQVRSRSTAHRRHLPESWKRSHTVSVLDKSLAVVLASPFTSAVFRKNEMP